MATAAAEAGRKAVTTKDNGFCTATSCSRDGSQGGSDLQYYALIYDVVNDFVARRTPHRSEHLRLAQEANRRGELILAGALGDPPDRALIIFRAPDRSVAEDFAKRDPYVVQGLVNRWEVRPWAVVVGQETFETPGRAV